MLNSVREEYRFNSLLPEMHKRCTEKLPLFVDKVKELVCELVLAINRYLVILRCNTAIEYVIELAAYYRLI